MTLRSSVPGLLALAIALSTLEALATVPRRITSPAASAARNAALDRPERWQSLRPEMSKADVLAILGAPPWTDRTMLFEFWMYEVRSALAGGVIVFERERDRVFSWRPPSGPP